MSRLSQHTVSHVDPVARTFGAAALIVALAGAVFAMTGLSQAEQHRPAQAAAAAKKAAKKKVPTPSKTPKKNGLLLLNSKKKYPASVIPTVASAKNAARLDGATKEDLGMNCPATAVDLGSWCLDASVYPVPTEDIGKNNFLYATNACVNAGGYLPTAAQLIGAAGRVKLSGTIDDSETTASTDIDPTDGFKDQREMSSTLITLTAGASAAGSQGVTAGSKSNPEQGEPDPVPVPRDPLPGHAQLRHRLRQQ